VFVYSLFFVLTRRGCDVLLGWSFLMEMEPRRACAGGAGVRPNAGCPLGAPLTCLFL
jgi:hypothetical protein